MDLIKKIKAKKTGLSAYSQFYGYYVYPKLDGLVKNRMQFNGQEVISWSFNDYLGLQCDERVIKAEAETVKIYGAGYPAGSRLLTGNTASHELLEEEIEKIIGKRALLFNLGYAAIISIVQSLLDRNDIVIYDQEVHASLIDGIRLHQGTRFSFQHNDMDHLENQLKRAQEVGKENSGTLVIVDGVFGMRGDTAKLNEIKKLKHKYGFTLLVDDAHAFQVFGEQGTMGYFDVSNEVDVYISTFAKAMGMVGGFVAGDDSLIEYFKYNLRSQTFGRTLPLINVVSVLFKLNILKKEGEERRKILWENTNQLHSGLKSIGINIGDSCSPITPVYLSCSEEVAVKLIKEIREDYHVFCSVVTYPVIPKGRLILRLIVTTLHTNEDINITLNAFKLIKEKYNL